jgi:hypothetical protein
MKIWNNWRVNEEMIQVSWERLRRDRDKKTRRSVRYRVKKNGFVARAGVRSSSCPCVPGSRALRLSALRPSVCCLHFASASKSHESSQSNHTQIDLSIRLPARRVQPKAEKAESRKPKGTVECRSKNGGTIPVWFHSLFASTIDAKRGNIVFVPTRKARCIHHRRK